MLELTTSSRDTLGHIFQIQTIWWDAWLPGTRTMCCKKWRSEENSPLLYSRGLIPSWWRKELQNPFLRRSRAENVVLEQADNAVPSFFLYQYCRTFLPGKIQQMHISWRFCSCVYGQSIKALGLCLRCAIDNQWHAWLCLWARIQNSTDSASCNPKQIL